MTFADDVWASMGGPRQNAAKNRRRAAIYRAAERLRAKTRPNAKTVACPCCGAGVGLSCTAPNGRACRAHAERGRAAARAR